MAKLAIILVIAISLVHATSAELSQDETLANRDIDIHINAVDELKGQDKREAGRNKDESGGKPKRQKGKSMKKKQNDKPRGKGKNNKPRGKGKNKPNKTGNGGKQKPGKAKKKAKAATKSSKKAERKKARRQQKGKGGKRNSKGSKGKSNKEGKTRKKSSRKSKRKGRKNGRGKGGKGKSTKPKRKRKPGRKNKKDRNARGKPKGGNRQGNATTTIDIQCASDLATISRFSRQQCVYVENMAKRIPKIDKQLTNKLTKADGYTSTLSYLEKAVGKAGNITCPGSTVLNASAIQGIAESLGACPDNVKKMCANPIASGDLTTATGCQTSVTTVMAEVVAILASGIDTVKQCADARAFISNDKIKPIIDCKNNLEAVDTSAVKTRKNCSGVISPCNKAQTEVAEPISQCPVGTGGSNTTAGALDPLTVVAVLTGQAKMAGDLANNLQKALNSLTAASGRTARQATDGPECLTLFNSVKASNEAFKTSLDKANATGLSEALARNATKLLVNTNRDLVLNGTASLKTCAGATTRQTTTIIILLKGILIEITVNAASAVTISNTIQTSEGLATAKPLDPTSIVTVRARRSKRMAVEAVLEKFRFKDDYKVNL